MNTTTEAKPRWTEGEPLTKRDSEALELLWDSLKRDPEHKDRRQTGWGTKTKVGLLACLDRIYFGQEPE